ncbi:TadE/TadG family type IV pilus assembly protein [Falsiroseomonas ponticola]|jgi:Flp pilus assembly protein TadG|uniref:TadE/TadG family type IV pilus assembly protein n=1 Tax=Falsiroseomonas ponticola TaxID=2786951 RepID=UPI001933560A|nr:TadE/TadG family type IV pilus assembly protein [Roseomonas ponticola]
MVRGLRTLFARLGRRGSYTIEFALLTPVFLTLLTMTMEIAWQLAIGAGLDHGTRVAARWAATGQTAPSGLTSSQYVARVIAQSSGMPIVAANLTVTTESFASIGSMTVATPGLGTSGQIVRYRIVYQSNALTPVGRSLVPNGLFRHSTTVISRNEPYATR